MNRSRPILSRAPADVLERILAAPGHAILLFASLPVVLLLLLLGVRPLRAAARVRGSLGGAA
jgi:hypothetical protein